MFRTVGSVLKRNKEAFYGIARGSTSSSHGAFTSKITAPAVNSASSSPLAGNSIYGLRSLLKGQNAPLFRNMSTVAAISSESKEGLKLLAFYGIARGSTASSHRAFTSKIAAPTVNSASSSSLAGNSIYGLRSLLKGQNAPLFRNMSTVAAISSENKEGLKLVDRLEMVEFLKAKNIPATQAEAFVDAITGGLESVMENVKAFMAESKEHQCTHVVNEFAKQQVDVEKLGTEFATMIAEQSREHDFSIHKIKLDLIKQTSDLGKDLTQLKVEYESAKLQAVKYAMATLASVAAAGFSWVRMMK